MVGHIVPADGVILDVASGTAGVALQLAARNAREHGQARVVGVDLTEPMLRQGQRRAAAAGVGGAAPARADAAPGAAPGGRGRDAGPDLARGRTGRAAALS